MIEAFCGSSTIINSIVTNAKEERRLKMKSNLKGIMISGILVTVLCTTSYAANYDFENMTSAELKSVMEKINEELKANHEISSSQETAVKNAVIDYVESVYGEDNVEWAWFDYSYSREWDYYTMKTHADIKKQDGGKAEYDILGDVVSVGDDYQVVYVKIGEEELFNNREEGISDQRVLTMLGLSNASSDKTSSDSENKTEIETAAASIAETENASESVVIAQRGDKSETALEVQKMLTRLGFLNGTPDGSFGEKTETAVKQFQAKNGLTEDGIVTQSVYDKLKAVSDAAPEPVEVISISAYDLYSQFDNNKTAAKDKYTGKIVQVSGTIEKVDESMWGTPFVSLKADEWGFTTVDCYFSKEDASLLAGLNSGQSITINGTCKEMGFTNVEVDDCSIIG